MLDAACMVAVAPARMQAYVQGPAMHAAMQGRRGSVSGLDRL